jgi:hypothetical protein
MTVQWYVPLSGIVQAGSAPNRDFYTLGGAFAIAGHSFGEIDTDEIKGFLEHFRSGSVGSNRLAASFAAGKH